MMDPSPFELRRNRLPCMDLAGAPLVMSVGGLGVGAQREDRRNTLNKSHEVQDGDAEVLIVAESQSDSLSDSE